MDRMVTPPPWIIIADGAVSWGTCGTGGTGATDPPHRSQWSHTSHRSHEPPARLRQYPPDRLAVVDLQTLAARHLQLARIQPQKVQHRRVQVRHVMAGVHRVE